MVAKKVAEVDRMSGMHSEAENRRRSTMEAPHPMAGNTLEKSALPWKSGMAQYITSADENPKPPADRAILPWVTRTALGAPVEPEVNSSRARSSGDGANASGSSPPEMEGGLSTSTIRVDERSSPSSRGRCSASVRMTAQSV